jgi:hypothetical protein
VVQQFATEMPSAKLIGQLPPGLEPLIMPNLSPSSWVSEAKANALLMAVRDVCYPDDDSFVAAAMRANRRLLTGPIYRVLMKVISPGFMVKNSGSRWAMFHQGISLLPLMESKFSARMTMTFPVGLVPALIIRAYATAFQVAIEASGGKNVTCPIVSHDLVHFTFEARWS